MPRFISFRLAAACAPALIISAIAAVPAVASTPAEVRVINTRGKILTDQIQYTGTTTVPTSKKADCFGPGSGGSGRNVRLPGATALGLVDSAAESDADLRPLSLSDSFDFGLAVCGFGGFEAGGDASWYLKVNHKGSLVGGDTRKVKAGDEILWYLAPSFPYPDELDLVAPAKAVAGETFTVQVFAYDGEGKRKPAKGVDVTGADLPTGGNGKTSVALRRSTTLKAADGERIVSTARVCVGRGCSTAPRGLIVGSASRDRIKGTKGPDVIRARGGRDVIDVRGGDTDRVNCGAGNDFVRLGPGDFEDDCEAGEASEVVSAQRR